MFKAGTETGSLVNHIYGSATQHAAEVGMGATILGWTDRRAATIVKVTPKQITVRRDNAIRMDKNGMSETQEYAYSPNPDAYPEVFRLTKRGWRSTGGNGLLIGKRAEYYDYSF